MKSEQNYKKWYQKKRYIIPLAVFGFLVIIAQFDESSNNSSQQQIQNIQSQQVQVQGQITTTPTNEPLLEIQQGQVIVTPTPQQTLEIRQEQPQNPQVKTPQPVEQPNYYTNSAGNKVQSPTKYDSGIPAGATALCEDGSYSFSQSRRGTCSHHGGVANWLD